MKKPSIEPKKRIFAQCFLSFHPKNPSKTPILRWFLWQYMADRTEEQRIAIHITHS